MKKIVVMVFLISIALGLYSQTGASYTPPTGISAYTFDGVRSGVEKLKINTFIWGQVYKPGLFVVPDDTDLLTLISLAGGPREDAKLSKIRIIRPTAKGERIILVNLKKYIQTGDETLIPILQPGDTVVVAGTVFYAFSRAVNFLSQVAIALSVYNTVTNLN